MRWEGGYKCRKGGLQMSKRGVTNVEKGGYKCRNAFCKLSNISKLQGHFFAYILNSLNRLNNRELFEWLRPSTALYLFSILTGWGNSTKSGVSGVDTYARGDSQEDTPSVGILRNSKLYFCAHKSVTAYPEEVGERAQLRQEPGEAKVEFLESAIRTRETKRTKSEQREKAQ